METKKENEKYIIEYNNREKIGKKNSYIYRKKYNILAIIYNKDLNIKIIINKKFINYIKYIYNNKIENIYLLNLDNKNLNRAYIKEIQLDPIKNMILHIDFIFK